MWAAAKAVCHIACRMVMAVIIRMVATPTPINMTQYIIDAFSDRIFGGNPAAILPLDTWLDDSLLQKIAAENNLSETAFLVKIDSKNAESMRLDSKNIESKSPNYHLRWFTPKGEIDLCGHATLASAFVVKKFLQPHLSEINFATISGILSVRCLSGKEIQKDFSDTSVVQNSEFFSMDFPIFTLKNIPLSEQIKDSLQPLNVREVCMGRDMLCIVDSAQDLINFTPNQSKIATLDGLLLHISTALDSKESRLNLNAFDCISRTFAPKCGVDEDAVCGSGHCHILPFWSKRLGKTHLKAYQASKRGGVIYGKLINDRISLIGQAALFAQSRLYL